MVHEREFEGGSNSLKRGGQHEGGFQIQYSVGKPSLLPGKTVPGKIYRDGPGVETQAS